MIATGRPKVCSECDQPGHNSQRHGAARLRLGPAVPPRTMKHLLEPPEKSTRNAKPARAPFLDVSAVPDHCPVPGCAGLWRWHETGISCLTAGHEFIVESIRTWTVRRRGVW